MTPSRSYFMAAASAPGIPQAAASMTEFQRNSLRVFIVSFAVCLMGTVQGMLKIGSCHIALAFRCGKLLDLLAKFSDGFPVIEVPLMPCCVILRRTTHHHDKPFSVKITKVVNKNIEAFSAKLVVWYRCHDCSSIIKSTGLAIRILPSVCNFLVMPLSVVKNQSQEAASAHAT